MGNPKERLFSLTLYIICGIVYKIEECKNMIIDKLMKLKIDGNNRKKYEKILGVDLHNGDEVSISQSQLLPSSRVEVECECDRCDALFYKKRVDIKSKSGQTYCGRDCYYKQLSDDYSGMKNPNPKKDKKRREELSHYVHHYVEIWETDIHRNLDETLSNIFNNRSLTTTRNAPQG